MCAGLMRRAVAGRRGSGHRRDKEVMFDKSVTARMIGRNVMNIDSASSSLVPG
jgi:hypothetical protein